MLLAVTAPLDTSWGMIAQAARGDLTRRDEFACRYRPVLLAYFSARWRGPGQAQLVEDAVHEVFLDCFKEGGVLARANPGRSGGFRAFLYGVARCVALRFEERRHRDREQQPPSSFFDSCGSDTDPVATAFDRAWAKALMREAADAMLARARQRDERALTQVEILRLKVQQGLPIREIAKQLDLESAHAHAEYRAARQVFRRELMEVVRRHLPSAVDTEVEAECRELLLLLRGSRDG